MHAQPANDSRAGTRPSSTLRSFDPFAALRAIRDACSLRTVVKAVAFAMIARANGAGECWPAYSTIGLDACVDRRTAMFAVQALEREGVIEKTPHYTPFGDRDSNTYRFKIGRPERPEENADITTKTPLSSAEKVVIADRHGSDPRSPKLLRELPIPEERRPAPLEFIAVKSANERDPWPALITEYSRQRVKKYGVQGLIEAVSTEKRSAVVACLNETSAVLGDPCEVVIGRVVQAWFGQSGRDNYLQTKAHPFRALIADLDSLIAADVLKARDRARTRAREEAPKERREAPAEQREARTGFAGASSVLDALRGVLGVPHVQRPG